jgi:anthranilate phosphoribosyltransferase
VETPEQSKAMLLGVLDNQAGPARDIVLLNAGAALYAANVVDIRTASAWSAREAPWRRARRRPSWRTGGATV